MTFASLPPPPHTHTGQYPGMYHPQPPTPPTSSIAAATTLGAGAAVISAEEERRHFEESERIKRQSMETAVEDKIRRQVKQVLDAAEVSLMCEHCTIVPVRVYT